MCAQTQSPVQQRPIAWGHKPHLLISLNPSPLLSRLQNFWTRHAPHHSHAFCTGQSRARRPSVCCWTPTRVRARVGTSSASRAVAMATTMPSSAEWSCGGGAATRLCPRAADSPCWPCTCGPLKKTAPCPPRPRPVPRTFCPLLICAQNPLKTLTHLRLTQLLSRFDSDSNFIFSDKSADLTRMRRRSSVDASWAGGAGPARSALTGLPEDGTPADSAEVEYVLSVMHRGQPSHHLLSRDATEGIFLLNRKPCGPGTLHSLAQVVVYLSKKRPGWPAPLLSPVSPLSVGIWLGRVDGGLVGIHTHRSLSLFLSFHLSLFLSFSLRTPTKRRRLPRRM